MRALVLVWQNYLTAGNFVVPVNSGTMIRGMKLPGPWSPKHLPSRCGASRFTKCRCKDINHPFFLPGIRPITKKKIKVIIKQYDSGFRILPFEILHIKHRKIENFGQNLYNQTLLCDPIYLIARNKISGRLGTRIREWLACVAHSSHEKKKSFPCNCM